MSGNKHFHIEVDGKPVELSAFLVGDRQVDAAISLAGSSEALISIKGPSTGKVPVDPHFTPGGDYLDQLIEQAQGDRRLIDAVRRRVSGQGD